jgi:antitoxin Phd
MTRPSWSLQDAKNSFSAVVDAAVAGEPQLVTRHGRPAVVIVSADVFDRMRRTERTGTHSFADMLLSMPQDDGEFERADVNPRDVEF